MRSHVRLRERNIVFLIRVCYFDGKLRRERLKRTIFVSRKLELLHYEPKNETSRIEMLYRQDVT